MSIELTQRCGVCRCYMDDEDLFCANCGTENPHTLVAASGADPARPTAGEGRASLGHGAGGSLPLEHTPSHYSFDCKSCGASMSYDASAQALRCPFCGSTRMEKRPAARSVKPQSVVPFSVTREQAEGTLRQWLGNGFWRPADAARASTIGEMAAVYVPYWVFEATTDTMWTADSSPAPPGSRGDWYPVSGSHSSNYPGILIGGSSILTPQETESIAPFRIEGASRPEEVDLENVIVEDFRVPRKLARPLARGAIEQFERKACSLRVPNRSRNLKVNVRVASMRGYPMLLPVWILAYQYKKNVHRVLINGQLGKIAGSAPFSYGKLTVVLLIVVGILALIALLAFVAAGR